MKLKLLPIILICILAFGLNAFAKDEKPAEPDIRDMLSIDIGTHTNKGAWQMIVHPEKEIAVTLGKDGDLRVWNLKTQILVNRMKFEKITRGEYKRSFITFTPNGKFLLLAKENVIWVIDFKKWEIVQALDFLSPGSTITFTDDGNRFIVSDTEVNIYIFDFEKILKSGLAKIPMSAEYVRMIPADKEKKVYPDITRSLLRFGKKNVSIEFSPIDRKKMANEIVWMIFDKIKIDEITRFLENDIVAVTSDKMYRAKKFSKEIKVYDHFFTLLKTIELAEPIRAIDISPNGKKLVLCYAGGDGPEIHDIDNIGLNPKKWKDFEKGGIDTVTFIDNDNIAFIGGINEDVFARNIGGEKLSADIKARYTMPEEIAFDGVNIFFGNRDSTSGDRQIDLPEPKYFFSLLTSKVSSIEKTNSNKPIFDFLKIGSSEYLIKENKNFSSFSFTNYNSKREFKIDSKYSLYLKKNNFGFGKSGLLYASDFENTVVFGADFLEIGKLAGNTDSAISIIEFGNLLFTMSIEGVVNIYDIRQFRTTFKRESVFNINDLQDNSDLSKSGFPNRGFITEVNGQKFKDSNDFLEYLLPKREYSFTVCDSVAPKFEDCKIHKVTKTGEYLGLKFMTEPHIPVKIFPLASIWASQNGDWLAWKMNSKGEVNYSSSLKHPELYSVATKGTELNIGDVLKNGFRDDNLLSKLLKEIEIIQSK